jgi:hypothetical protein
MLYFVAPTTPTKLQWFGGSIDERLFRQLNFIDSDIFIKYGLQKHQNLIEDLNNNS